MSVFIETCAATEDQNQKDGEWKRATRLRLDKAAANRFVQHAVRRAQAANKSALQKKEKKERISDKEKEKQEDESQVPPKVRRSLRLFVKHNPEMKNRVLTALPALWTAHKTQHRFEQCRKKVRKRRQESIQEQRKEALKEPQLFSFNLILPPFLCFGLPQPK